MDLQGLQIFIEVAETKSFTRAAENLGYSQPTVSFQIKQLETELGCLLFDRIGRTVSLTQAGAKVLIHAQDICHRANTLANINVLPETPQGIVRLGMADSLCSPLVCARFAAFRKAYPHVSLKIITAGTRDLFRMLDHNEVDILCTLDDHIYDTNYVIAQEEMVGAHFVASSLNPLAQKDLVTVKELVSQDFLLTEKGMSYRRLMDQWLAQYSLEITPVLEMGSADQLSRLVSENLGISLLPDYVTKKAVAAGKLVYLNVPDCPVKLWKQLLYRKDKWLSPSMEAIMEHLKKALSC